MQNGDKIDLNYDRFQNAFKRWLEMNPKHIHPLTTMMEQCGIKYCHRKQACGHLCVELVDKTKFLVGSLKYGI